MSDLTDWIANNLEYVDVTLDNMALAARESISFLAEDSVLFECVPVVWLRLCADIVDSIDEEIAEELHETSLVYSCLYDVMSSADWHRISLFCSAYEPALRDLRYSLEDMVASLYLDETYGSISNRGKAAYFHKLPGMWKMLEECHLPKEVKDEVYSTYRKLCGFAHPSSEIPRDPSQPWKPRYGADRVRFCQAMELFTESYDCITLLVLHRFPHLLQYIRGSPHTTDVHMLERARFRRTLSMIRD